MKISHQWLRTYVPLKLKPDELADRLSMLGLEVERYEDQGRIYSNFVVGEVFSVTRHPNADKLTVCSVSVGKDGRRQIVCGAPNVAVGQKVAVGLVGATVPRNQHDPEGNPFTLGKVKIRGVESEGMICSAYELGTGDERDGILVLPETAKPGTPLARQLGKEDVIYDIEITANRGDWLSHIGVAREIAAMTSTRAQLPRVKIRASKESVDKAARVRIEDRKGCRRYVAMVVRNVRPGPSPEWLQNRLAAVGVRPINVIVDVTNFVMLETGQPLHAFDLDKLSGQSIAVRSSQQGETFTTLDGKERSLREGTIMICDAEKPVAIGGIMGGMNSEISEQTTNVLLESAWFDPGSIRKSARALGMSTDASQRFERGVDITGSLYAAQRAVSLLEELAGGTVLRGAIDVYPVPHRPVTVTARVARINQILGTTLSSAAIASLLGRLELKAQRSAKTLRVRIPPWRRDLTEEVDLIEEVGRLYGYNNIETRTDIRVNAAAGEAPELSDQLREHLIGGGFNEMVVNSLQRKSLATLNEETPVEVLNPVSADMEMLRTSLIPGALEVAERNYNRGVKGLRLFELGTVYWKKKGGPVESLDTYGEERRLLMLISGQHFNLHFSEQHRNYDILDLKGEVESMLSKFFLDKYRLIYYDNGKSLSVDNILIEIQGTYAGFLGRLRKEITAKFGISEDVFAGEFKLDVLSAGWTRHKRFSSLQRFPGVTRDLAFVVDAGIAQSTVEEAIRKSGGEYLAGVTLFDLYTGEQLGAGKKSFAYTLEFMPRDRTLTDREVNEMVAGIIRHVGTVCGATVRS